MKNTFGYLVVSGLLCLATTIAIADSCMPRLPSRPSCPKSCDFDQCCSKMGGVNYCDSSAGRFVCNNGSYSSCYCTRHAIMDLQAVQSCCLWQGGVLAVTPENVVLCRNGGFSEECTRARIQAAAQKF